MKELQGLCLRASLLVREIGSKQVDRATECPEGAKCPGGYEE